MLKKHPNQVPPFDFLLKIQFFCCFITQLVKKLQEWSLYEVIEDILLLVLNIEKPLSDIKISDHFLLQIFFHIVFFSILICIKSFFPEIMCSVLQRKGMFFLPKSEYTPLFPVI